jgi:hypothetical protein
VHGLHSPVGGAPHLYGQDEEPQRAPRAESLVQRNNDLKKIIDIHSMKVDLLFFTNRN